MHKMFFFVLLGISGLLLFCWSFFFSPSKNIMDYDGHQVLGQYISLNSSKTDLAGFKVVLQTNDPLQATSYVFRDLYNNRDLNTATAMMELLLAHWNIRETKQLSYLKPHGHIPAGWISGMDSLLLPLTLVAIHQEGGDERYGALARELLERARRSPPEGGVTWQTGNGCWISEYAWDTMKPEDEFYVLNGHLFAMEALKLLADALNDKQLEGWYQCTVTGLKEKIEEFATSDTPWPRYMLLRPSINQPHYVIYEKLQFSNLYELTGDEFYLQQQKLRERVLERSYPIYRLNGSAHDRLFFSLVGGPNIDADIYGIEIECRPRAGAATKYRQFKQHDARLSYKNRLFINERHTFLPGDTCKVTSVKGDGFRILLYESRVFDEVMLDDMPQSISYANQILFDAYEEDGSVYIDPAIKTSPKGEESYYDTQGRVEYLFPDIQLSDNEFVGIELTPTVDLNVGILLEDGTNTAFRYYPPLKGGMKNIMIFSKLGFEDGIKLESIKKITVYIYTHEMHEVASLDRGELLIFANHPELSQYLSKNDAYLF